MAQQNARHPRATHITFFAQQGDVLIQAAALPAGHRQAVGRVLASGEVTGHAHRLTETSDGLLVEINGQLYLSVGVGGAAIVHEEHLPIMLPPGDYKIDRVQEYDHFAEEARSVRD